MNFWPFKKKLDLKCSDNELSYLNGFYKGFEIGIQLYSELDEKIKSNIRNEAISETLLRLNGNDKKIN